MEKTNAEVLKDILQLAKAELNEYGHIGYTMPDGKHHIFISVEETASWDRVKEKLYVVEPNRVEDGAHEPMGDTYGAPYQDFADLLVGCAWCLEVFEQDREMQKLQTYDDAMAHLSAVKAREFNWNGLEPIFESTNYFGIYSGEWENECYLVDKRTGEHIKVLDGSDWDTPKNYLKELACEVILDVASVRLLDNLIRYMKDNLSLCKLPDEELSGVELLSKALNAEISKKSESLLSAGTEVDYCGSVYEVIDVRDSVVFLQNCNNDHHTTVPLKRFLDEAQPVSEDIWVTVYKDTIGYSDDHDNLTEILLPKEWLQEALKAEGVEDLESWLDEYTADETDGIARRALDEGVILECSDKNISIVKDECSLERKIQNARGLPPGDVCWDAVLKGLEDQGDR